MKTARATTELRNVNSFTRRKTARPNFTPRKTSKSRLFWHLNWEKLSCRLQYLTSFEILQFACFDLTCVILGSGASLHLCIATLANITTNCPNKAVVHKMASIVCFLSTGQPPDMHVTFKVCF